MSEETPETTTTQQAPGGAAAPARRRPPRQDAVLTQATELARAAVSDVAGPGNVGRHLGVDVHEDRLLTHLFDCTLAGYPGWTWFATVARAPRSKHTTVCEVGLRAGQDSLLAPPWIPWEERMQAVNEQREDRGEGQEQDPRRTPETPTAAEGGEAASTGEDREHVAGSADGHEAAAGGQDGPPEPPGAGEQS